MFSRKALATAIKRLRDEGIEGVIIGSTSYMLALNLREFEDDIDLFVTSLSPTFDEEVIREKAEELGCFVGQTEWGTPQLHCTFEGYNIVIELYENMYDFYIPEVMLNEAIEYKINDTAIKSLRVEDYIVLKAKSGRDKDVEDLMYLGDLIKDGRLSIKSRIIKDRLKYFEDYEINLIMKRLRSIGLSIT